MGMFSDIVTDARRGITYETSAAPKMSAPAISTIAADTPSAHNEQPIAPAPAPAPAPTLDLSGSPQESEDERRRAHEAAEAKRKAEWEAKQQEKRRADAEAVQRLAAMSDAQASADAAKRVAADTEKLTRRNMKEMVCEHIQDLCGSDPAFARRVMHPRKSMIRCFKYITRKAREFAEQEMKDNDIKREGVYGCDVPDGLCYQWAVDYFNDPDAAEDKEGEEKFVAKPYVPKTGSKPKPKAQPRKPAKKPESDMEQISLLEVG